MDPNETLKQIRELVELYGDGSDACVCISEGIEVRVTGIAAPPSEVWKDACAQFVEALSDYRVVKPPA